MGSTTFCQTVHGETAIEAFNFAQEEARYDHGHSGYTGTIAEKHDFVMIDLPEEYAKLPVKYSEKLFMDDDPRIDNKWGPAGCIDLGDSKWLFFGWASE